MADTLDVLTLPEAKAALNLTGDTHDSEIALWVTAVSRRLDDACGPVVQRNVTEELHDGGAGSIWLHHPPVASVTSVSEFASTTETLLTAETNVTKPAAGYLVDLAAGRVVRRSGGGAAVFAAGSSNVEVSYVAGRYATTAAVDAKFKAAAGAVLRRLWAREQGAWARGGDPFTEAGATGPGFFKALDPMIREFLADELRAPVVA